MDKPTIIKVDFTGCTRKSAMADVAIKAFDLPDWCNRSWDGFWDLFAGTAENTIVEIYGSSSLPEALNRELDLFLLTLQRNRELLDRVKKKSPHVDCRFSFRVVD